MKELDTNSAIPYEDKKKELQHYKETVDIRDYLVSVGYKLDKERDTKSYRAYGNEQTGDKVYVPMKNKYPIASYYVNQFDKQDKGTIIDFISSREKKNIEEVRQTLRNFSPNTHIASTSTENRIEEKKSVSKDDEEKLRRQRFVIDKIVSQKTLTDDSYLKSRFLTEETIQDKAFKGKVFINETKEINFTAFPISKEDNKKVAGLAMKSTSEERFLGEREGLWLSNPTLSKKAPVDRVVINEHPLDSMSYYQLKKNKLKDENIVFVSTAGNPSESQINELRSYLIKANPKIVTLGNDNDHAGKKYNKDFEKIVEDINLKEKLKHPIEVKVDAPVFKDFTADVKALKLLEHRHLESHDNSKPKNFESLKLISEETKELIENKKYKELAKPENVKALRESYTEKEINGKIYAFSVRDEAIINNNRKLFSLVESGQIQQKGKENNQSNETGKQAGVAAHEAKQLIEGKATGEPGEPNKSRKEQLQTAESLLDRAHGINKANDSAQKESGTGNNQEPKAESKMDIPAGIVVNKEDDLEKRYYSTIASLQQQLKGDKDQERTYEKLGLYKQFPHLSDRDIDTYVDLKQSLKEQGREKVITKSYNRGANEI